MAWYARQRTLALGTHEGYTTDWAGGNKTIVTSSLGTKYMSDIVGNFDGSNGLVAEFKARQPATFSGEWLAGNVRWFDVPTSVQPGWGHLGTATPPTDVGAITEVVAKTNPSRPEVSMPQFIFELRELPGMMYNQSPRRRRKFGNSSVASYNFGWELLISDVAKLLDFGAQVDKRVKELTSLHHGRGLKRRRTVWTQTVKQLTSLATIQSAGGAVIQADISTVTMGRKWASVNWKPDIPGIPPADEMLSLARRVVHGWDLSPSTVWEILPWSWMADYFGNIGDVLGASRNTVGAHPTNCCVMRNTRTTTTTRIRAFNSRVKKFQHGRATYETLSRLNVGIGLEAHFPMLSAKQVTTLSGIALNYGMY